MTRRYFFTLISAVLFVFAVTAQSGSTVININLEGAQKDFVSLSGIQTSGAAGELFKTTLQNDLLRSGCFKIASGTARISVSGTASGTDSVATNLTVTWPGKRFTWNRTAPAEDVRLLAHQLADEMVKHIKGQKGIATTRFSVTRRIGSNNADLFVFDYDGRNMKQITNDRAAIVSSRWSPDGNNLYFTSYRHGFPSIYRTNLTTGKITALGRFKGLNAGGVPSPTDPSKVALILSHQGNPELYVLDTTSGKVIRLTNTKLASEASPSWSPDGKQIVYVSDATRTPQLFIVDVATRQSRRITFSGSENVNPDWGSNGLIAFATRRGAPYQIAVINPKKGESSTQILTPKNETYESPSWAPNSRHIICSCKQGKASSIFILDSLDPTEKPYRVFSGSGDWLSPAWSPR